MYNFKNNYKCFPINISDKLISSEDLELVSAGSSNNVKFLASMFTVLSLSGFTFNHPTNAMKKTNIILNSLNTRLPLECPKPVRPTLTYQDLDDSFSGDIDDIEDGFSDSSSDDDSSIEINDSKKEVKSQPLTQKLKDKYVLKSSSNGTILLSSKNAPIESFTKFNDYIGKAYDEYKTRIYNSDVNKEFPLNVRALLTIINNNSYDTDYILDSTNRSDFILNLLKFTYFNKNISFKLNEIVCYVISTMKND